MYVCGAILLEGPALVAHLQLPYPVGQVTVQSLTANYDPALFMLSSQCSNNSPCGQAVYNGLQTETLDLTTVDSGDYFLVIAPFFPESTNCGQILVTYSMTQAEVALAQEGLFRGGVSTGSLVP